MFDFLNNFPTYSFLQYAWGATGGAVLIFIAFSIMGWMKIEKTKKFTINILLLPLLGFLNPYISVVIMALAFLSINFGDSFSKVKLGKEPEYPTLFWRTYLCFATIIQLLIVYFVL